MGAGGDGDVGVGFFVGEGGDAGVEDGGDERQGFQVLSEEFFQVQAGVVAGDGDAEGAGHADRRNGWELDGRVVMGFGECLVEVSLRVGTLWPVEVWASFLMKEMWRFSVSDSGLLSFVIGWRKCWRSGEIDQG